MILLSNNFLIISRWSFFPAPRGNTDGIRWARLFFLSRALMTTCNNETRRSTQRTSNALLSQSYQITTWISRSCRRIRLHDLVIWSPVWWWDAACIRQELRTSPRRPSRFGSRSLRISTTVFCANIRGSASAITLVTTPNYLATDKCITVHALPVSTRLFTRFFLTLMLIPYKFSTGFVRSRVFTYLLVSPSFLDFWYRLAMCSISAHRCDTYHWSSIDAPFLFSWSSLVIPPPSDGPRRCPSDAALILLDVIDTRWPSVTRARDGMSPKRS